MGLIAAQTPGVSGWFLFCACSKKKLSLLTRKNPAKPVENRQHPIAKLWWWTDETICYPLVVKWRAYHIATVPYVVFWRDQVVFWWMTTPCHQIKGINTQGFDRKMKIAPAFQMGSLSFSGYFHLLIKTPNISSLDLATGHRPLFISRMTIMLL